MQIVKHQSSQPRAVTNIINSKVNGTPVRSMAAEGKNKPFGVMMYGICASLGISNAPEPVVIEKVEQTTLDYYADFTDKEVMLAYDLAAAGQLDLGHKGFNSYEINVKSHCDILRAFRKYRSKTTPQLPEKTREYSEGEKFTIMATGVLDDHKLIHAGESVRDLASVKSGFMERVSDFEVDYSVGLEEAKDVVEMQMKVEKMKARSIGDAIEKSILAADVDYFDFRVKKHQALSQYIAYLANVQEKALKSLFRKELDKLN